MYVLYNSCHTHFGVLRYAHTTFDDVACIMNFSPLNLNAVQFMHIKRYSLKNIAIIIGQKMYTYSYAT